MSVTMVIGEWVQAPGLRNGMVPEVDCVPGPRFDGQRHRDETNKCTRSYGFWDDFCRATGLRAMFFDKHVGLFRKSPDIVRIDPHHAGLIRAAIDKYITNDAGMVADWEDDGHLGQLHWLLHWFEWSLAHCKVPAIANT